MPQCSGFAGTTVELMRGSQVIGSQSTAQSQSDFDPSSLDPGDVLDVYVDDSAGNPDLVGSATYDGTSPSPTIADCQNHTVSGTAPQNEFVAGYLGTGRGPQTPVGAAVTNGSFTLASNDPSSWLSGGQASLQDLDGISYVAGPDGPVQVDQWTSYPNLTQQGNEAYIPQDINCASTNGPTPTPAPTPQPESTLRVTQRPVAPLGRLSVSCSAGGGCPRILVGVTIRVIVRDRRVIDITKADRAAKRGETIRTLVVARTASRLAAGRTEAVTPRLDTVGRRLVQRFGHVPARITISAGSALHRSFNITLRSSTKTKH